MESLKAYISLVDPRLLNQMTGKTKQFIQTFQQHKFLSEEAFIQKICGKKYDRRYYGGLKSRTIKTLQILLIMSPPEGVNLVKKKYDVCQKKFLLGQKLLTKGEREEGIRLIKQARQLAVDYNFVHLGSELSSALYHHHVYYDPNDKIAEFYVMESEQYMADYVAEKKAEHCLYRTIRQINSSVQPEIIQNAIELVAENKGASIKYRVYAATLEVMHGFHAGDFLSIIRICRQTLEFFNGKKGVNLSHHQLFLSKLGIAQMAIGHYPEAEANFQKASEYAPHKSFNDYLLRFYRTLNALRAGEYQKAYDLYLQNRKCRLPSIREQFAIIEAYLCFLAYTGHLQFNKPFRLGKYLNDTFKAQADKQGDNINILIAELLVYLARDKGKFIDRIEAVKYYSYRHLKGEDTRRAKWFIKILCLLPSVNFHPTALARRAKTYIDRLEQHPVSMGENFAIETIPFENLLEMIFVQLKQKVA